MTIERDREYGSTLKNMSNILIYLSSPIGFNNFFFLNHPLRLKIGTTANSIRQISQCYLALYELCRHEIFLIHYNTR